MAIILDGPVTPADGTVFIRNVPQPSGLFLSQLLPDVYKEATEVDFTVVTRQGNTARFRALDAPAHQTPRDSMVLNRAPLIPLSGSKPIVGEQELARLYGLEQGNSPVSPQANAIYDDLTSIGQDILRRAEQARGAALSTGLFAINEGGMNGTIDYGIPGGNKLTAPALFTVTGQANGVGGSGATPADIIGFLNAAKLAYIRLNGYAPGSFTTSTYVQTLMQQNRGLQSQVASTLGSGFGGYLGLLPNTAMAALLGQYDLPAPSLIYDTRLRIDGVDTYVMPQNVIVLGPPAGVPLGYTQWGPTVTARKLAQTGALSVPAPGVIGFIDKGDEFPYNEQSYGDSLMLPVIENPNALMILTVA